MAKVVDLGVLDPSNPEVAIDRGSDVADKEWVASLGHKEGSILGLGSLFDVLLNGLFGGFVQRNTTSVVALVSPNFEIAFLERNVLELDTSEFANTKPCLEEDFDDSIHADVVTSGIAEGAILERSKSARRSYLILGV